MVSLMDRAMSMSGKGARLAGGLPKGRVSDSWRVGAGGGTFFLVAAGDGAFFLVGAGDGTFFSKLSRAGTSG